MLTGQDCIQYTESHVFAPAGMDDTGYYRLDQLPEGTATGYMSVGEQLAENIYAVPIQGGPEGGAYTTALDLHKFWQALLAGQIVSETMLCDVLKPFAGKALNGLTSYTMEGSSGVSMISPSFPP